MILDSYGLIDATPREKEIVKYRMCFSDDIYQRVGVNYSCMEDVMELSPELLEDEDNIYLKDLKTFIEKKPFSEVYLNIENLPYEFTDMNVAYVDLVIIHELDKS